MNEEQIRALVEDMLSKAKVLHWIGAESLREANTLKREICVSVQGAEVFLAVKDDQGTAHFYPELQKVQDLINQAISGITDLDAKVSVNENQPAGYLADVLWASQYIGLKSESAQSLTLTDRGRLSTNAVYVSSPSAGIKRWALWRTKATSGDLTDSFSIYARMKPAATPLIETIPLVFDLYARNNLVAGAIWINKPQINGLDLKMGIVDGQGFGLFVDLPDTYDLDIVYTHSKAGLHAADFWLEQWTTPSTINYFDISQNWIESGFAKNSMGALTHQGLSQAAVQYTEIDISTDPQNLNQFDLGTRKLVLSQSNASGKLVIPNTLGVGGSWTLETKGSNPVRIQIQGGNTLLITPNQVGVLHIPQGMPSPAIRFDSISNKLEGISATDTTTIDHSGSGTAADPLVSVVKSQSLGVEHIRNDQLNTANGLLRLDGSALVPSIHLPSYVDDVLEFASQAAFPATGETGKIYIAIDTNESFRWSGSVYVKIGDDTATGTAGGDLVGSYPNPAIATGAVSTAKLADNSVSAAKIQDNAVITARIADAAVTLAKMAANSVDASKIVDGSVGTAELANDSVTNTKLANMAAYTIKANNTNASADPADYATATNSVLGRRATGLVNIPLTDPEFIKYQQTPLTDASIVLVSSFGEYGIWIHPASGTFNTEGPRGGGNYFGTFQTIVDGNSTSRNYIQIYGDSVGVSIRGGDSTDSGNITWSAWQQVGAGATTLPALTDVADDVSAADPAQDGEVLTWDNTAGNWQRKPIISNTGPVSAAVASHDINDTDNTAGFTRGLTAYNGGWGLSRASFDAQTTQVAVGQGVGSSTSYTYAILEVNSIANGGQTGTLKAKGSFTIPSNAVGVQTLNTAFKVTKGKFYCLMIWAQQASSVSFLGKAGRTNFGVTFAFSSGSIPNGALESTYSLNSDTTDRIWFSIEP